MIDRQRESTCNFSIKYAADLDTGFAVGDPKPELSGAVVIIGAGNIGTMLATRFLLADQMVHLVDIGSEQLTRARGDIAASFDKEVREKARKEEMLNRCTYWHGDLSTDQNIRALLVTASCVIEALPESLQLKERVLGELDSVVPPHIPISTVTSSFPVSELLAQTTHRGRFINSHPLQKGIDAIEMMPSRLTERGVADLMSDLFSSIGMVPIEVHKENVGFIFNIIWKAIKETALNLVEKGVATPEDIDRLWMMALKTKIGPFGMMDMVGLDVVRDIEARYAAISSEAHKPPPALLEAMVREGSLGVKTGRGFYTYPNPVYTRPGFIECGSSSFSTELTPTRDTLLGAWKLESFTATIAGADQVVHPMGPEPRGQLIYGLDGAMSVNLSVADRGSFQSPDPLAATPEERMAAYSQFFTYCGRYRYGRGVVYHDVELCSFPNWQGATVVRSVSLTPDGTLVLSTPPFQLDGNLSVQELRWRRAR